MKKVTIKKVKSRSGNTLPLMLLAAPGLLYMLINNYIPIFGIFIAFKEINYAKGIFKSDWVGLKTSNFCLEQMMPL